MYTIEVTDFTVGENSITIRFTDGHEALWIPPTGGQGMPNTIAQIRLVNKDGQNVAVYNSPYQHPRTTRPDGFTEAAYPIERILAYLQAGYNFVAAAWRKVAEGQGRPSDKLRSAWPHISHSRQDLLDIRNGRWPIEPQATPAGHNPDKKMHCSSCGERMEFVSYGPRDNPANATRPFRQLHQGEWRCPKDQAHPRVFVPRKPFQR